MQTFRRAYNTQEESAVDPLYVEIEILDVFPHDHPLLDEEPDYNELSKEMSITLNSIIKNDNEQDKIDGFMFVYDSSNRQTFETMTTMVDTIKEIEKSERRGKKQQGIFVPAKVIVGNKRDLKRRGEGPTNQDFKKVEGIRIREVSSLTNNGVNELFKWMIQEIHQDPVKHLEIHNKEKEKNKNNQDEYQE